MGGRPGLPQEARNYALANPEMSPEDVVMNLAAKGITADEGGAAAEGPQGPQGSQGQERAEISSQVDEGSDRRCELAESRLRQCRDPHCRRGAGVRRGGARVQARGRQGHARTAAWDGGIATGRDWR